MCSYVTFDGEINQQERITNVHKFNSGFGVGDSRETKQTGVAVSSTRSAR